MFGVILGYAVMFRICQWALVSRQTGGFGSFLKKRVATPNSSSTRQQEKIAAVAIAAATAAPVAVPIAPDVNL